MNLIYHKTAITCTCNIGEVTYVCNKSLMQWQKHLCATVIMMDMYKHILHTAGHIAHCTCSCEDGIGTTKFHVLYVQLLEFKWNPVCHSNTVQHVSVCKTPTHTSTAIKVIQEGHWEQHPHPHMVIHNMLHSTHQVPEVSSVSINFIKLVWNRSDLQRRQESRPNHLCTLIL